MAKTSVQTPEGNVKVKESVAEEAQAETPSTEDVKEEVTVKKGNGNGSFGKRNIKLADMATVELTKTAFGKLTPEELVATLIDPDNSDINRISRERAAAFFVERVKAGKIKLGEVALADVTYRNVVVAGVELPKTVRGVKEAKVTLTPEQFGKLTPEQFSAYVEKYTHKRRIANVIIPDYIAAGMPMTAEDVVSITNGRVSVKGVVVPKASNAPAHAIVDGVQFD